MATTVITSGTDTYVDVGHPKSNYTGAAYPKIGSTAGATNQGVLLQMPGIPVGSVVLSASLSGPLRGTLASGLSIGLTAIAESWSASKVTYNTLPSTTGAAEVTAFGALSDGDSVELDVTSLCQAVAAGQANYGWFIGFQFLATASAAFYGFDSGHDSWTLTIETSDQPVAPTQMTPHGVISLGEWTCQLGDADDIAQMRVQTSGIADPTFPGFDSGWVAVTAPVLDLSSTMTCQAPVTTTSGSATITAATQTFSQFSDVGTAISGAGIPAGATITAVASGTSATISAPATASATVTATLTRTLAGIADGASTYWRAAFKTSTGAVTDFGDWVQVTRHVKPSIVMDSPPAGLVYDSTPTIEAHLSPAGTTTTRWRVRLLSATDSSRVLYDSGNDVTGATLSHTIPHQWRNKVAIGADGPYRLQVYCWDRSDRVGSYGDPPYELVDETMTVDVDGTVTAPSGLTVAQPGAGVPDVVLHWTSVADPDYFTAIRDGVKIPFQIDPDDARIAPGVFEWVDATAAPNVSHTWRVRAHVGTRQSTVSVSASLLPTVTGIWLRSSFGTVLLRGNDVDSIKQTDKRTSFPLPYAFEDVDVIGAVSGYSADSVTLAIDSRALGTWTQDVDAARTILEEIRQHSRLPVQLIWGTVSIPVYLRGLSVSPYSKMIPGRDRTHAVSFGFFQTDDVQQAGFGVGYYGAGTYF